VESSKKRYKRTEKGKQAQETAIAAYRLRRVKWEVWLDTEMSIALEASIPDGVTRSDYVRTIFQKHLDSVSYMIDNVVKEHKTSSRKK
jgi:hypothetical protein